MADFKTALEALATGKIQQEALSKQLDKLLQQTPDYAVHMLQQLDAVHAEGKIDDKAYTSLKRQINQYRRTHSTETEGEQTDGDATVFDQGETFAEQAKKIAEQMAEQDDQAGIAPQEDDEDSTEINEATRAVLDDEDSTEINEAAKKGSDNEDSTEINKAAQEDKTFQKGANPDATQVMSDTEHEDAAARSAGMESAGGETSGVDFDLHTGPGTTPSVASATGPTGTEWQQPTPSAVAPGKEYGPGDVIKQRFKLLKVLGIGGMGKVYMATDLLKEEARDKKPNVAIKLLNDDFKDHPEAFISLQRESSRQQKLAHPNIATIYDFDRVGGPGTPVFITMELMEGMELKDYIKKVVRKQGGIPFEEAFKIVKQLGDGLIYAHDRRLVHSDFKPGNAFLCNDGTVKTLDFGIARAVKNPVTGEAEKTLFDPGKLGALTPAYASLEMLEGEEPDTRDDIYALGCVAYELLTGKHPFNKLPATTARENGLVPPYVKTVNKKTNRALRRAVAFRREDRSPTVAHFIEEFEGKPTWHKHPATWAAGVLLAIGIMSIPFGLDVLNERAIEGIIADINSGNSQVIAEKLEEIQERDQVEQDRIISSTRDAIQRYYGDQIARLIDITGNTFNFPEAQRIIDTVSELYPESAFILEQQQELEFNKNQKITDLYNDFIAALGNTEQIGATQDVLNIIRRQIDPSHPLLTDSRPANAYRLAADAAFAANNYEQALSFIDSGLETAPDDARLADSKVRIERAIEVDDLRITLGNAQDQMASLSDFQLQSDNITRLAQLSSPEDSPVLETLSNQLQGLISTELARIETEGSRVEAEQLANEYGDLLSSLLLAEELTQIKLAHLSGAERSQRIAEIVSENQTNIETRLTQPNLEDPQWESLLLASVRELESLTNEDGSIISTLITYRERITQLYIDSANSSLQQNRFDNADALVDRGIKFDSESLALQELKTDVEEQRIESERQDRIRGLKDDFVVQTDGDQITQALQLFDQLKEELGETDSYMRNTAPTMLAGAYSRLAERSGEGGDFESAMQLVNAGLEIAPRDPTLQGLYDEYVVEVNITELSQLFPVATPANFNEEEILRKVDEIRNNANKFTDFSNTAEQTLADRIRQLAQTDERAAAGLADSASNVFPASNILANLRLEYQLEPWPDFETALALAQEYKLTEADSMLQVALTEYSGHPQVIAFQQGLEQSKTRANDVYDQFIKAKDAAGNGYNELRSARRFLSRAMAYWVDNPDYVNAEEDIENLIAAAPDNPSNRMLTREQNLDLSGGADQELVAAQQEWEPVPSPRECKGNLAGRGKRARGICFDLILTGSRGPLMVVVPSGEEINTQFAIGKYEVSIGDYSKYCYLSGNCSPELDEAKHDNPVTGISLADAQKYAEWLSERTGKTYRIPTKAEWEYAANSVGETSKSNINCRVEVSGKVIKGTGVAPIKSGNPNDWGLYNFVGNVQEMVNDDTGPLAVGGAYEDQLSKCDISLQRPLEGNGDNLTGFRVLLEEVG